MVVHGRSVAIVGAVLAAVVFLGAAGCARPGTMVGTEASPMIDPPTPSESEAPSPAPTDSTSTCRSTGLAASVGEVDAAMGLRAMSIFLLNCGTKPLTVEGYPAVQALDGDQRVLDVTILNGTDPIAHIEKLNGPPQRVTAAPGERFVAAVVWRNTVADVTPAVNARFLDVALAPGQPVHRVAPEGGLDLGTTGRFAVSPWTRV